MSCEEIVILTYDEAVAMLPEGEPIHTFMQAGPALIGADTSRGVILIKLRDAASIQLSGPQARSMGHGLVAVGADGEPLFIETGPPGGTA